MSIESILEREAAAYTIKAGRVTAAVGANTLTDALAGGTFGTDFAATNLLFWLNDAGQIEYGVVQAVAANVITLNENVRSVSSGGVGNTIYLIDRYPDYFVPSPTYPNEPVHAGFDGNGVGALPTDLLKAENGRYKISSDEGVLVKSIYARLPYQYTFADGLFSIKLEYLVTGAGGAPLTVTQIGENGEINIPMENVEIPVNQYIPPKGVAGQTWELYGACANAMPTPWNGPVQLPNYNFSQISTVNAPTELEYTFLPIIIGVRIEHASVALTT